MKQKLRIKNTKNATETMKLGQQLVRTLRGGETLALIGDLGSGKTTFVKGLARGLGVKNKITSPTFVLFKPYQAKHKTIKQLIHADCYRVTGSEFLKVGLTDYLTDKQTVVVIEWADKLKKLPPHTITINFNHGKTSKERLIKIK
ncbi:MAG: tRNA (adenosine(37)-N6)-threonylcarbamoyltransferase complex ATPase subunit type 1 TsaE [Patescibacteria group bacterium]